MRGKEGRGKGGEGEAEGEGEGEGGPCSNVLGGIDAPAVHLSAVSSVAC